jgi:hypothetical protein
MEEELPQFSGILGGITAVVVSGVAAWRKWGPKPVEEKHSLNTYNL